MSEFYLKLLNLLQGALLARLENPVLARMGRGTPVFGEYPLSWPRAGPGTPLLTGPVTGLGVTPYPCKGPGTRGWKGACDQGLGYPLPW